MPYHDKSKGMLRFLSDGPLQTPATQQAFRVRKTLMEEQAGGFNEKDIARMFRESDDLRRE